MDLAKKEGLVETRDRKGKRKKKIEGGKRKERDRY